MLQLNRVAIILILLMSTMASPMAERAFAQDESNLLARINDLRTSLGLAPYGMNGALNAAAVAHARWMVDSGQVSHIQPDGSNPRSRAAAAGYASQFVSENIYGGTNASVDVAWNYWVNSSVHYRGLTNPGYQDIGIGIARGEWGAAYVLVFGSLTADWQVSRSSNAGSSAGDGDEAAPPPPPSFVVGLDTYGNIMHEIQPGDTVGDIALLYGYTWDDLPYMMQLNELDDVTVRELKVGAVFLVPPSEGTYTPTPAPATNTPTPTPQPSQTPTLTATPTSTPTARTLPITADASTQPATATETAAVQTDATVTQTPLAVAQVPPVNNENSVSSAMTSATGGRSVWLLLAIGLQVVLIVGAGIELVLRQLRR